MEAAAEGKAEQRSLSPCTFRRLMVPPINGLDRSWKERDLTTMDVNRPKQIVVIGANIVNL